MKSPGVAAADPQAAVECAVECKVKTPTPEQSNEKENAKVEKEVNAEKRRLEAAVVAKLGKVDATVPTDDHVPRRLQLGSAAISTVAHLVVLALLGLMTFATQQNEPRDISAMVATSSSTGEADQLETVPIEAAAAPESAASSESATSEMAVQPMAELTAATGAASLPMAASAASSGSIGDLADAFSEASQSALSGAAMSAMNGDAKSTVFCGVSTGGSRICFLVDSSRSMSKGRFEAARDELLRTIDSFSADKRFYVIFFDENPAAMSFNSSTPERYLAMATDENKRAVRTWAMTVEKEPGKAPDEALKLAFKLEPEVIFLLTDGEFPDRTEALIRQLNQRESLLGDSTHRCIVHTIAFHGKEGIERLKRIATAHKGTFRYVAPPGGNP